LTLFELPVVTAAREETLPPYRVQEDLTKVAEQIREQAEHSGNDELKKQAGLMISYCGEMGLLCHWHELLLCSGRFAWLDDYASKYAQQRLQPRNVLPREFRTQKTQEVRYFERRAALAFWKLFCE